MVTAMTEEEDSEIRKEEVTVVKVEMVVNVMVVVVVVTLIDPEMDPETDPEMGLLETLIGRLLVSGFQSNKFRVAYKQRPFSVSGFEWLFNVLRYRKSVDRR